MFNPREEKLKTRDIRVSEAEYNLYGEKEILVQKEITVNVGDKLWLMEEDEDGDLTGRDYKGVVKSILSLNDINIIVCGREVLSRTIKNVGQVVYKERAREEIFGG